ncbi:MAG: TIM23 complex component [Bogoriella megaspora]|nr:MAG: TIM23 complex component [Bogoriella megaspora]
MPIKAPFSTVSKAPKPSSILTMQCLRTRPTTILAKRPSKPSRVPAIGAITRSFTTSKPTSFFTTRINTATSTASSTNPAQSTSSLALIWNDFFQLRKRRRYISLVSSIVTSGGCLFGGVAFLSTFDLTEIPGATTLGLDPFILLGLETFAFAVAGWLAGPVAGEALFRMVVLGRGAGEFQTKEREFFNRIKKHRADPANSSVQNPVPDYYGEKIGSVKDYRRWLKDQRAFNLKRQRNLV